MINLKTKAIRKLAVAGYAWAQFELGRLSGVEGDIEQKFYWYRQSARQGYPEALERLALEYYYGKRIKQDFEKALMLVIIAGLRRGKRDNYLYGELCERLLSEDAVKEAERKAAQWQVGVPL